MTQVRLDLNSPIFQADFVSLGTVELKQAAKTLRKLLQLTWEQVYADSGLKWEEIKSDKGTYTIRLSQSCRAIVMRDADLMRFFAIHAVHDGAYGKK